MHRLVALLLAIVIAPSSFPCTTFSRAGEGETLFGRNYDFEIGDGMVMVNAAGLRKRGYHDGGPAWSARYGSVTFNQWGREFPMDGMNDAGLVIALMWLDETVYPRDERPALRVLEWIQYGLDNYSSVDQLLSNVEQTRIAGGTPLHYLIADASGDVATIEYLEGRLVVHRGATLPVPVLANDSYERSLSHLRQFSGFGGFRGVPNSSSSLDRFVRASSMMKSGAPSVDRAFEILKSVAQPGGTRWSVVYDAARKEVSWVSDRTQQRRSIHVTDLALQCAAEARMLDIHAAVSGDVTGLLETYSAERNRELVVSSYATTSFTRNQPEQYAIEDAAHAESFRCAGGRRRSAGK